MKLESYGLFKEILSMFSYILEVSIGYILLISICSKAGKLHKYSWQCYTLTKLFKHYFKGAKIWWLFAQLYKNSIDCVMLEVSTVDTASRF